MERERKNDVKGSAGVGMPSPEHVEEVVEQVENGQEERLWVLDRRIRVTLSFTTSRRSIPTRSTLRRAERAFREYVGRNFGG